VRFTLVVGQRGFWDEQKRVAKLQQKKPVLRRLSEAIPWETFRPLLLQGYTQERKSNAGRKRIDPGRVPLRGVNPEARLPWSESEQG